MCAGKRNIQLREGSSGNVPALVTSGSAARSQTAKRKQSRRFSYTARADRISARDSAEMPQTPDWELLAAVGSLYDDELRPYGRIVRKRLAELALASRGTAAGQESDLGRLRATCERCGAIRVQSEEGGEWSALLVGRTQAFIDIYSTDDVYPQGLWAQLAFYLDGMEKQGGSLPGGRYGCAVALWKSGLPCLAGRSLGQVCHIVQLAMAEKRLLGYLDGVIAPYMRSQSMLKDAAAEHGVHNSSQQLPLATWAAARSCLVEILASAVRKGKHEVPLSNLKRLFRSRFHCELSETALGYTKISDMLQDPRLHDVCVLHLLARGYVVRPRPTEGVRGKKVHAGNDHMASAQHGSAIGARPKLPLLDLSSSPPVSPPGCEISDALSSPTWPESPSWSPRYQSMSVVPCEGPPSPTLTASPSWTPRAYVQPQRPVFSSTPLSCRDSFQCPPASSTNGGKGAPYGVVTFHPLFAQGTMSDAHTPPTPQLESPSPALTASPAWTPRDDVMNRVPLCLAHFV